MNVKGQIPLWIKGVKWDSYAAAARHFGLDRVSIRRYHKLGRADEIPEAAARQKKVREAEAAAMKLEVGECRRHRREDLDAIKGRIRTSAGVTLPAAPFPLDLRHYG